MTVPMHMSMNLNELSVVVSGRPAMPSYQGNMWEPFQEVAINFVLDRLVSLGFKKEDLQVAQAPGDCSDGTYRLIVKVTSAPPKPLPKPMKK